MVRLEWMVPEIKGWQEETWKKGFAYGAIVLSVAALLCLWFAHLALHVVILIILGTVPPEWLWIAQLIIDMTNRWPASIAAIHDAGIFLSFFAFVFMFVWLVVRHRDEKPRFIWKDASWWRKFTWFAQNSDAYYILAFIFIAVSWVGVWVFIHQAFLFYLESSPLRQGTLTDPTWFLIQIQPLTMVIVGTVCVIGAFIVLLTLIFHHRPGVKKEILKPTFRVKFGDRLGELRYIKDDWLFYLIAFIPFFLAAFAIWIFTFEGLFALIVGIEAFVWAWLPSLSWSPPEYHWWGIGLLGISFGWFIIHILIIERNPVQRRKRPPLRTVDKWRNRLRHPFAILTLGILMAVLLFIGVTQMILAFNAAEYFSHTVGRACVIGALIVVFILIVAERGFDDEKRESRENRRLRRYKEYIPQNVIEERIHYFRSLSPIEREKKLQETIQRYIQRSVGER